MFFWRIKDYVTYYLKFRLKASLRACHTQIDPNTSDIINNPKRKKIRKSKRTFFPPPSEYRASMCLETALSFSFFMLFMVNIFSIIFVFATYARELTLLQQQGKKISAYTFMAESIGEAKDGNIRLQKNEKIESPFLILAIPDCRLQIKCVVKPWTGYDVAKSKNRGEEEQIVYMTEYGTVYHRNRSCTHLALSIQAVAYNAVSEKRNEWGECYYPCEYCGENSFVTVVFLTSHGNRYHTTGKCQGLKRSVKSVPLSEVEGVNPCKKCG